MLILGLETSCDETSVALVEARAGHFVVHKNLVSSQVKIHRKYGGVVPEVAARRHVEVIVPLLKEALGVIKGKRVKGQEIKDIKDIKDITKKIDVIAVTAGPGLMTSLLVGVETARTLSYLWKKPLVAVNHLEGHIYANWLPSSCHSGLEPESRNQRLLDSRFRGNDKQKTPISNFQFPNQFPISNFQFPILCLIVSGGHTELILMKDHLKYKLLGQTRDDAAGECFDKVGKMLGLPYPGGPEVARLASRGNPQAVDFPRPMMNNGDFSAKGGPASGWDFSFSGLKTAVLYFMKTFQPKADPPMAEKHENIKTQPPLPPLRKGGTKGRLTIKPSNHLTIFDICASFQQAAVDVLVNKTLRAAQKYQVKTILLGGGVASNLSLQKQLAEAIKKQIPNIQYPISNIQYYSDNAAMIAAAAYFHALKKDYTPWSKLKVDPNWELVRR